MQRLSSESQVAALVAAKSSQVRCAGFSCWIFGNLIWVLEGAFTENIYLVVMFGFYWITAVFGFYNSAKAGENKQLGRECAGNDDVGN
ncbi:MAG: hypothetical protein PHV39_09025 [Methanomicrobium sp.]|nr:hypothetical protein [Methanomicrobium sp.]